MKQNQQLTIAPTPSSAPVSSPIHSSPEPQLSTIHDKIDIAMIVHDGMTYNTIRIRPDEELSSVGKAKAGTT